MSASSACSKSRSRCSNDSSSERSEPQPHSLRNRARAARSSARRTNRHGPLVEHVLPREHRAAERRLPQRVAGALTVRHVEQRPDPRIAPAAGEKGRAAGAVVERVAGTPDDALELFPDATQARDPLVDLVQLLSDPRPHRFVGAADAGQPRVLGDLLEREAEPLRLLHGLHEPHRLLVVVAVAVDPARRLVEQAPPLVVAERLDVYPGASGDLSDPHNDAIVDPYLGTDVEAGSTRTFSASRSFIAR